MKFEEPIVEIQKFDLKDIISASGEGTDDHPVKGSARWEYDNNYDCTGHTPMYNEWLTDDEDAICLP